MLFDKAMADYDQAFTLYHSTLKRTTQEAIWSVELLFKGRRLEGMLLPGPYRLGRRATSYTIDKR
jgi:cell division protein YceG involved in septum cleavage